MPTFRELINQKYPDLEITHVHHAGNSSGVVDGAAAVLYASEHYVKAHGLEPRARIVASGNMGDDPTLMLNAPVPSARKILKRAGMTIDDIDLFEVNEAFAVVSEKFMRDLDLDRDKVNVNGGAMALGHPSAPPAPSSSAPSSTSSSAVTSRSVSSPCAPAAAWPPPSSSNVSERRVPDIRKAPSDRSKRASDLLIPWWWG